MWETISSLGKAVVTREKETVTPANIIDRKIGDRIRLGKPADVLCLDLDGTLYTKTADGKGVTRFIGDNGSTAMEMKEKHLPWILDTGRMVWGDKQESFVHKDVGLPNADVVIAASGTLVYWRDEKGKLKLDNEWQEELKKKTIRFDYQGERHEEPYNPTLVANLINTNLINSESGCSFRQKGCGEVNIFENDGIGLVSVDVAGMKLEDIDVFTGWIKGMIGGVKVLASEHLGGGGEVFTGRVHIVPDCAGKEGALEYVLKKICSKNKGVLEKNETGKLDVHIVGDASVDVPMLAMGSGSEDPYRLHQYVPENITDNARPKLVNVAKSLYLNKHQRQMAERLQGSNQAEAAHWRQVLENKISSLSSRIARGESDLRNELHQLIAVKQFADGWKRADIHFIRGIAAEAVFNLVHSLK